MSFWNDRHYQRRAAFQAKLTERRAAVQAEARISERLGKVLKGVSAPISTGGSLCLDAPPTVALKDADVGYTIEPVPKSRDDGWQNVDEKRAARQVGALASLTERIPAAPFGRGEETVYDKSVRDALQLKAEEFVVDIPREKMDGILAQVKNNLQLKTDIVAERYSLNVYGKGGKFVKHKDTPRGEDMVGTLLICLPTLFKGGEIQVTMGTQKHSYFNHGESYSKKGGLYEWWRSGITDDDEVNGRTLPWCAFYADVDHEIKEVTAGLRMTVAYLLRRKDTNSASADLPREIAPNEQATMIRREFELALLDECFLKNGGKMGSPCLHLYTNGEVFPRGKDSSKPLGTKQIHKLKGRDLMVAEAAASHGLDVYLVPFLSYPEGQGDLADLRLKKFPKKKKCPRQMSEDTVKSFFDGERDEGFNSMHKEADVWILDYGDPEQAAEKAGSAEYEYEGYFGNEASHTDFYVKSALFIDVPDFESRKEVSAPSSAPPKKRLKTGTSSTC